MSGHFITPATWKTELQEVAHNVFAYVQAHGEFGVSNAGLIVDRDSAIAVDALMVPSMTRRFRAAIKKVSQHSISKLINTHHHIDHTGGNHFFRDSQIISHTRARDEIIRTGVPADLLKQVMPRFGAEFDKLKVAAPAVTFTDRLTLHQASRTIELHHPGAAHTFGDALVHLPKERVLFAGDIAFHYVTPLAFQGHVGNWIKVANRILKMDVETIVPGHGQVGTKRELRAMRDYLQFIRREAQKRFTAGLSELEAAHDIQLGIYARWREPERILPNVMRLYQEFRNELEQPLDAVKTFVGMQQFKVKLESHAEDDAGLCCV